jgi:PAS domain S-box-containing protein
MEPSDALLRGLLAAAPDALIAVDPTGRIVFANDQAEWLFGWPKAELLAQPVEILVPERFRTGHPGLRAQYVSHPTKRPMGADLELWSCRRDGSEFPVEISLSSFETVDGLLVAAAIRDATAARRSEQRFRAVLDAAPDATIGVSLSGRVELVNAQAERLFGWTAAELVGAQVEMLVPGGIDEKHVQHRADYAAEPRPRPMGAGLPLSALRKDGSTFPAEISRSTVADDVGELMVLASVRDIGDRMELEAERRRRALEAQREQSHRLESLGQLAGGVAHDFNNLLGVILNYATLMARHVDDPTALSDLEEIRTAAQRGASLTGQLLTFARRDVVNREPLDVNAVVSDVTSMLRRTFGEHIELKLDLDHGRVHAICDRTQFERIVLNLAINARDAMPAGGVLTIATRSSSDPAPAALVSVKDTGHGMTQDVQARAFEPFFTTKPRGSGTGLGLATVYGIVRQNDGEIRIDSTVGQGTTMSIVLPGALDVPLTERSRGASGDAPADGHERVLLVEDEIPFRLGTARLLEEAGYDVVVATNGVEALEKFAALEGKVDIIVTDIAMPHMRGDDLAVQLRLQSPDVPMLFMTGYDSGGVSPLVGRVLAKPVAAHDLLQALREVLDE